MAVSSVAVEVDFPVCQIVYNQPHEHEAISAESIIVPIAEHCIDRGILVLHLF